jgi:hypothetical protein
LDRFCLGGSSANHPNSDATHMASGFLSFVQKEIASSEMASQYVLNIFAQGLMMLLQSYALKLRLG